ncbi:MAG TPA: L-threonylcarbamoyladenylate synthase [Anaeromyxobacter sp.]|nr:L-threonylcarbamoyladenylate synthase [Anaeromyxobacter sp.]
MHPELARRIEAAAAVLRRGGLVAYPTETFYGLGALARDRAALARLARAKLRPEGKPLPLLAADLAQVEEVAVVTPEAARLAARFWPGPLTLVLAAVPGLDDAITAGTATVAIRVPGSDVARALARAAGGALVSTSANVSGEPPPADAAALSPALVARLDHVLDGGTTPGGLPSTIVSLGADGPRLVRAGVVPFEVVVTYL